MEAGLDDGCAGTQLQNDALHWWIVVYVSSAACLPITLLVCFLRVLLAPRHAASACIFISILRCPSARVPITQFYIMNATVGSKNTENQCLEH